jgi:hypothetical protein
MDLLSTSATCCAELVYVFDTYRHLEQAQVNR